METSPQLAPDRSEPDEKPLPVLLAAAAAYFVARPAQAFGQEASSPEADTLQAGG
jgi:hypothetical protein